MENNEPHILVIRLSAMGDVAMTVPVLINLTQQYPTLKITVLTRKFFTPLFADIPNVKVFVADVKGKHKGLLGLYTLFKELKNQHITAVADLHNVLRSRILKQYFGLTKIPFKQIDKGRAEKKALTTATDKVFKQLRTTHQRYADVFNNLGYPINIDSNARLFKNELSNATLSLVGMDTKKWIGIAPFAAFQGKIYPLSLMKAVVKKLDNTNEYKILFFGGKDDEVILDDWEQMFQNGINMAGKLQFTEELALISNLDIMIAMDSGNAHLSAMYGIPTVTIWGVTHPFAGFYPFGQDLNNALLSDRVKYPKIPTSVYGNKFPDGYENVMETITPTMVFDKILKVLSSD